MMHGKRCKITHVRASWPTWLENPGLCARYRANARGQAVHRRQLQHWRIDFRFVSEEIIKRIEKLRQDHVVYSDIHPVFNIVISRARPENDGTREHQMNADGSLSLLEDDNRHEMPRKKYPQVRGALMKRQYPRHPSHMTARLANTEDFYAGYRLIQQNAVRVELRGLSSPEVIEAPTEVHSTLRACQGQQYDISPESSPKRSQRGLFSGPRVQGKRDKSCRRRPATFCHVNYDGCRPHGNEDFADCPRPRKDR